MMLLILGSVVSVVDVGSVIHLYCGLVLVLMLVMGMLERTVEFFGKFRLFGVLVGHNFGGIEFLYLLS